MKLSTLALFASTAFAAPIEKRALTDADILQYALTLEHLENVFYKKALQSLSESAFEAAGFSAEYYKNLQYIAHDEEAHVELLTSALSAAGAKPVAACEYSFPFTDAKSFVTLSSVLEGVGTSAYLGGAGAISSKDYLGVAASILVTEAIHTSLTRFQINRISEPTPYGTGLGPNEVYTLAAAFIKSCPSSNVKLPFMAFPTLTSKATAAVNAGDTVSFTTEKPAKGDVFLTFVSGLTTTSVKASGSDCYSAAVPAAAAGQVYVVLTSKSVTALSDDVVIAGPAIIEVNPGPPTIDFSES